MSGFGKKTEPPKADKSTGKPKNPPSMTNEDNDYEDGDFATPKRDRDDEQQDL
ncbi:MAG: hypothetical protein JSS22_23105 [Proteobacteria bacterium]|nr:hypothetical protein [Pseudomonadota bacterium]